MYVKGERGCMEIVWVLGTSEMYCTHNNIHILGLQESEFLTMFKFTTYTLYSIGQYFKWNKQG